MDSLKGSFLVASPGLVDPNFARTVVFMAEHNREGAFGLVLTRPSELSLPNLAEKIFEEPGRLSADESLKKFSVFSGGPVQTSAVFFLHTLEEAGEQSIDPGVFLGSQIEDLQKVLARLEGPDPPQFKIFMGYSGWGAGQLERELKAGGWLVRPATLEHVFEHPAETLWSKLVQSFGGDLGILGLMPPQPELN